MSTTDKQKLRRIFRRAQKLLRMTPDQDEHSQYCCDCIWKAAGRNRLLGGKAVQFFEALLKPGPAERDGYIGWWNERDWTQQNARLMALRICELAFTP